MTDDGLIAIIGGGIQGLSTVHQLLKRGVDGSIIAIFEENKFGSGETERSASMLMGNTLEPNKDLLALNARSLDLHRRLSDPKDPNFLYRDTGSDIPCGSVLVATTDTVAEGLEAHAKLQTELGIPTKVLTQKQIHEVAPYLNADNIKGALYCPQDEVIDQAGMIEALRIEAKKQGVYLGEKTKVTGLMKEGNRITGIQTERMRESARGGLDREEIPTRIVVNAAGALSDQVARWAGLDLPIRNTPRTLWNFRLKDKYDLRYMPIVEMIDHLKFREFYIKPGWSQQTVDVVGQTEPLDEILADLYRLGETPVARLDNLAIRIPPRHKYLQTTLDFLQRFFPGIELDGSPPGGHTGIRSCSADGLPIIGKPAGIEGFMLQCLMSGYGITDAPGVSSLVAEHIVNGKRPKELEPFALERFYVGNPENGSTHLLK